LSDSVTPVFVSIIDASRLLGCGRSSIYEYAKSGDLHLVHHGRRSVIAIGELNQLSRRLADQAGVPADVEVRAPAPVAADPSEPAGCPYYRPVDYGVSRLDAS
jgi:hypothetical protein